MTFNLMQKQFLKQPNIVPDLLDLHQMLITQIRKTVSQNLLDTMT